MSLLRHFLDRCNALLVKIPFDDVLLDIQATLSQALQDLEVHSYQQSRNNSDGSSLMLPIGQTHATCLL